MSKRKRRSDFVTRLFYFSRGKQNDTVDESIKNQNNELFDNSNVEECRELYSERYKSRKGFRQSVFGKELKNNKEYPNFSFNTLAKSLDSPISETHLSSANKKYLSYKYLLSKAKIKDKKDYMYIVSPKGGLYIHGDPSMQAMSQNKIRYHSDIRSGQPVQCAGFCKFSKGKLSEINDRSGHYRPNLECLEITCLGLYRRGIATKDTKIGYGDNKKVTNYTTLVAIAEKYSIDLDNFGLSDWMRVTKQQIVRGEPSMLR